MRAAGENEEAAAPPAADEADKDKRRRRRQNRRTKLTVAGGGIQGGASGSMDSIHDQPPEWSERTGDIYTVGPKCVLLKTPNAAFRSLPSMHISGRCDAGGIGEGIPSAGDEGEFSQSCPLPNSSSPMEVPRLMAPYQTTKKHFVPHWSENEVEDAIKKGYAFKATFRVNAHNRLEAYCTIDGITVDVLISGLTAQNRAIEGDVVAVTLDPVVYWSRMKGSNAPCNTVPEGGSLLPQVGETSEINAVEKEQAVGGLFQNCNNGFPQSDGMRRYHENGSFSEAVHRGIDGHATNLPESSHVKEAFDFEEGESARAIERIQSMINSNPAKRPTGKVVSIIKKSTRREAVIGFLSFKPLLLELEFQGKQYSGQGSRKNKNTVPLFYTEGVHLVPTDSKFPKMVMSAEILPDVIKERLSNDDPSVELELVAARMDRWNEESPFPEAQIVHMLGKGGETETHIGAILFEHAISDAKFSPESLACLPDLSWKIPVEEFKTRRDLRNILTFTIDPSSAIDLDDALSIEVISDGLFRIGVHIADVCFFVRPDTALDTEAQVRSTSVYILQHKLPMLPSELSERAASLVPGTDKLAFSIIWDIDSRGNIVDRWIGRSIIYSCCKLSYDFVQDMIDLNFDQFNAGSSCPRLHGEFEWVDVLGSLKGLHEISKKLKEMRFKDGALCLEGTKLCLLFDEGGTPYDSFLDERKEACSLVEEFMLLANRSVAEVISNAYPDCALLRRHPEPNLRRLKEFEAFCCRHGFELDASSSSQLHLSLSKIREKLKDDPVLFDILMLYASKPMQSAAYFCTSDLKDKKDNWAHYGLSVPLYTHFTSPLRRYPDVIVHRTLCAVIEAEEIYLKWKNILCGENKVEAGASGIGGKCFTSLRFDKNAAESKEGRKALLVAAVKLSVPGSEELGEVAAYSNERKLASRHAEEAGVRVYLWALLKSKGVLVSEARVLGLGPRFMSVYVHKLAIERRIHYDEVEGLAVEWLETTGTLVIDIHRNKHTQRKWGPAKYRPIDEVALLLNLVEVFSSKEAEISSSAESAPLGPANKNQTAPAVFPLVLQHLSVIPVALHATGGDDGPLDIGVRLYASSYFK